MSLTALMSTTLPGSLEDLVLGVVSIAREQDTSSNLVPHTSIPEATVLKIPEEKRMVFTKSNGRPYTAVREFDRTRVERAWQSYKELKEVYPATQ
jgi:hypothetical protein